MVSHDTGFDGYKGRRSGVGWLPEGAFILSSDDSRKVWLVSGPHSPGSEVYHVSYDPRNGGTVFAAVNQMIWRPTVQRSHDLGATWLSPEDPPRFISGIADRVDQVWHVEPGRSEEPGSVYLGVAPAALFRSDDYGSTWNDIAACLNTLPAVNGNRVWAACASTASFRIRRTPTGCGLESRRLGDSAPPIPGKLGPL